MKAGSPRAPVTCTAMCRAIGTEPGQLAATMCGSPGSGGHRAQVSPDRCRRAGRGSGGRLQALDNHACSVDDIASCVIVTGVAASVECGRRLKQPRLAPASSSEAALTTAQSLYDADSSGIIRIMDSTCDTVGTGTGFLIGPNLIATVGHVVEGADDIRVTDPALGTTSSAVVLGFACRRIKTSHSFKHLSRSRGTCSPSSTSEPAVGASIVVLGFSKDGPGAHLRRSGRKHPPTCAGRWRVFPARLSPIWR